jgi:hypothetical protein
MANALKLLQKKAVVDVPAVAAGNPDTPNVLQSMMQRMLLKKQWKN